MESCALSANFPPSVTTVLIPDRAANYYVPVGPVIYIVAGFPQLTHPRHCIYLLFILLPTPPPPHPTHKPEQALPVRHSQVILTLWNHSGDLWAQEPELVNREPPPPQGTCLSSSGPCITLPKFLPGHQGRMGPTLIYVLPDLC